MLLWGGAGCLWSSLEMTAERLCPAVYLPWCILHACSAQPHSSGGESSEQPSWFLKGHCLPRNPLPTRLPAVWSSRLWEKQLHVSIASWLTAVFLPSACSGAQQSGERVWMSLGLKCRSGLCLLDSPWCVCIAGTVTGQGDDPFMPLLCTVLHGTSGPSKDSHLPTPPYLIPAWGGRLCPSSCCWAGRHSSSSAPGFLAVIHACGLCPSQHSPGWGAAVQYLPAEPQRPQPL